MEYALGPVLALLIAMKFADYKSKKTEEHVKAVETKVEMVEKQIPASQAAALQKTMVLSTGGQSCASASGRNRNLVIRLDRLFGKYREPHQIAAINMLEQLLPPEALQTDADWYVCWMAEPDAKETLTMEDIERCNRRERIPKYTD